MEKRNTTDSTTELTGEELIHAIVTEVEQLQSEQFGNTTATFDSLLPNYGTCNIVYVEDMLAESGPEITKFHLGTGLDDTAPSDCDIRLQQNMLKPLDSFRSNFVEENNEISPADGQQLQDPQVEPTAEVKSSSSDYGQVEQRHESVGPSAQPMSLFQDDNIHQSDGSLHMKQIGSVRTEKVDGKRFKYELHSTEAPPENPQSSRAGSETHSSAECKKQFNSKSKLTRHVMIHTGEKPFQCEFCNASFNRALSLKIHQRIHSGEKPYKCEEKGCKAAFRHSSHFKMQQRVHSGEKPYKCEERGCNSAFKQSSDLKTHRRIHSGEKPYKCEERGCNSAFKRSSDLTKHQLIHSGEKPYKCQDCNAAFSQASNLKTHQQIHSDDRPFMCNICKKSFRRKSNLSRHMDIHSGRTAHKCNVCEQEFSRKSTLTKHFEIHLKEKPSQL